MPSLFPLYPHFFPSFPALGCTGEAPCACRESSTLSVVVEEVEATGRGISDSAAGSIERDPCLPAGSIRPPGGARETFGDGEGVFVRERERKRDNAFI